MAASRLGTKSYWDEYYATELSNYAASGDPGVDWFAENVSDRLMSWLCDELLLEHKEVDVLDIGSGNGAFLFELEERRGWEGSLVGIDYSEIAVDFATKAASDRNSTVSFALDDVSEGKLRLDATFHLVHDKGTFDAYMLSPDARAELYVESVFGVSRPGGYLVVTSCNNTVAELKAHFTPKFSFVDHIPYPTIRFGGSTGAAIATVTFIKQLS